jgi:hypothetical protein
MDLIRSSPPITRQAFRFFSQAISRSSIVTPSSLYFPLHKSSSMRSFLALPLRVTTLKSSQLLSVTTPSS